MKKIFVVSIIFIISICLQNCSDEKANKSISNLKESYQNSNNLADLFLKYSEKAKAEGYSKISNLFSATSKSEAILAYNFKKALENLGVMNVATKIKEEEVNSTHENINRLILLKQNESSTIFPKYIESAKSENAKDAVKAFSWAKDSGTEIIKNFKNALTLFDSGNELSIISKWLICPTCGNIYNENNMTDACDLCSTSSEKYIVFEIK